MERIVAQEILDELPADDPRAIRSRRDLRRINRLMGHARILARLWRRAGVPQAAPNLVDLGAGDGTFCLELVRRLLRQNRVRRVLLFDQNPAISNVTRQSFEELGCALETRVGDVFDWLPNVPAGAVVIANLFVHHFSEAGISRMFEMVAQRSAFFFAVEPRRARFSLLCSRLLPALGCNAVTCHDAVASVRAGFVGGELSSLWPRVDGWRIAEIEEGLFSHTIAVRRSPQSAERATA